MPLLTWVIRVGVHISGGVAVIVRPILLVRIFDDASHLQCRYVIEGDLTDYGVFWLIKPFISTVTAPSTAWVSISKW